MWGPMAGLPEDYIIEIETTAERRRHGERGGQLRGEGAGPAELAQVQDKEEGAATSNFYFFYFLSTRDLI